MSNETEEKKWKVEFVGMTELFVRDKIATYVIDAPNLTAVKRRIPKIAEEIDHPKLTALMSIRTPEWWSPSKKRHVCHYQQDNRLKDAPAGYYIFVSPVKVYKPHHWYMPFILLSALTAAIIVGVDAYNKFSNRELRAIFTSTYPEYGKKVLKVNRDGFFNGHKLKAIVKDFNRDVRGIERNYILTDDYDNMIRLLTRNQYRLEHGYLIKTPQYGEEHNEQSTDQRD